MSTAYSRVLVVPPFFPSPQTDGYPADFALCCPDGQAVLADELDALCRRYQQVFVHEPFLEAIPRPLPDNCFPLSGLTLVENAMSRSLVLAVRENTAMWPWLRETRPAVPPGVQILEADEHTAAPGSVFLLPGPSALNGLRPKYFSLIGNFDLMRDEPPPAPGGNKRLVAYLGHGDGNPSLEIDEWVDLVREAAESTGWEVDFLTAPGAPDYPGARPDDESLSILAEALGYARALVTACPRAAHTAVAMGRSAVLLPRQHVMLSVFRNAAPSRALPTVLDADGLAESLREIEAGAAFPGDRERYKASHGGHRDPRQSFPRLLAALGEAEARTLAGLPDMAGYKTVADQPALSVFVFGTNPRGMYSGGRYHAWIMAESLALAGHDVTFVTNVEPLFSRDFALSPAQHRLKVILTSTYNVRRLRCAVDCVIIVPAMFGSHYFYENAVSFSKQHRAHACLLNFESPNWFNALSPVVRDALGWADWARTAQHCSMIISALEVNSDHAQRYYSLYNAECRYLVAPPPINDMAADIVPVFPREDRIVAIIRFDLAEHKGVSSLLELIDEPMRGHVLALLVGHEKRPEAFVRAIEARAAAHGVTLEFLDRLNDQEKFRQLSRAKLLLFMSQFEGYGYPPLEALYCGTPCLSFDLEPLRETCGDLPHYAPLGDWAAFKAQLAERLAAPFDNAREAAFDADSIRMITFGDRLGRALYDMCTIPLSNAIWTRAMPSYKDFCTQYRQLLQAGDRPPALPAAWLTVQDASLHDGCVLSLAAIVVAAAASIRVSVNGVEVAYFTSGDLSRDIAGKALLVRRILPPQALVEPPEACTVTIQKEATVSHEVVIQLRAGGERSPAALFIENLDFDLCMNRVRLIGWAQGPAGGYSIRVTQRNQEPGYARLNLPRPDIAGRYGLGMRQHGWSYDGALTPEEPLAVEMLLDGRLLARRRLNVKDADTPIMVWRGLAAPAADGPVAAVITHVPFLPVRQGNHIVIDQLLRWLRSQGYRVFLVLQIHPRFLVEHQAAYQAMAERIFIVNPEVKTPGTVALNKADLTHINTKRCLHDIASRHDLRLAIAEYVHFAAALTDLPATTLSAVQTHDALFRLQAFKAKGITIDQAFRNCSAEEEKKLLRCAKVIIAIQHHERRLFANLVPEKQAITVGVSRDAFGEPLPPSPEQSRSVFIAASGNPFNVAGLKQFLEHCWPRVRQRVPDARLRLAGRIGQEEGFAAPGVECLGLLDSLDGEYENAAVCINPVTMGTGLKIKSVETLARGRALVSTSVGLEGIGAHGHRAFVVADTWPLFADAVAELLVNVAYRHDVEREATAYARRYLEPDFVYHQLAETLALHTTQASHQAPQPPLRGIV